MSPPSAAPSALQTIRPEPAPAESRLAEGLELGPVIGRGGTAVVREATQLSLGRRVAVKAPRPELASRLAHVMVREARVIAQLQHPGVAPVHDLVPGPEGAPRIVMARIEGRSWLQLLAEPQALARLAGAGGIERFHLETLVRVAQVIEHAHARGLIHRDLKPENVMLGALGQLYVVDWGLAMRTKASGDPVIPLATGARQLAGTPGYMAPEQLGGAELGPWTDVFLLGALLYHLLVGLAPYGELEPPAIFEAVRRCRPQLPSGIDPSLRAILRRALRADPGDRYPSVTELREALERHLAERHAASLCRAAERRLAALEQSLARGAAPAVVHALHGEVVFGYRQTRREAALPAAERGLQRAALAMARWALQREDPDAAELYLAKLEEVPPELEARRQGLLQQREAAAAELQALRREADLGPGRTLRTLLLYGMAASWVLLPLLLWPLVDVRELGMGYNLASSVGLALMALVGLLLLHGPLVPTAINRAVVAAVAVVAGGQLALDLGGTGLGLDPAQLHALRLPLWAAVCALMAATVRAWLWLPALAYLLGYAAVVFWLDALLPAIAWSNSVFASVVITLAYRLRGSEASGGTAAIRPSTRPTP